MEKVILKTYVFSDVGIVWVTGCFAIIFGTALVGVRNEVILAAMFSLMCTTLLFAWLACPRTRAADDGKTLELRTAFGRHSCRINSDGSNISYAGQTLVCFKLLSPKSNDRNEFIFAGMYIRRLAKRIPALTILVGK